ncbi:hypothetical protein E4631_14395 [Hymenobacter sp. UV11]|uniref:hypothetical protein n=1 Tax=Hymenobacter sp. UV11 TaxID=1849735 RepID=UPI00105BFB1F|nr:hypothetical protein [Hymenobacter sp. UV11]TDN39483.1 hypothetical protein A8B98_19820 [Hymenobacter sp. UV11]TFZ65422.1 hypothetical protein E4631_14395 [Hymenobacter sp. UV11]
MIGLSAGCARRHFFQPDARLPAAAGQRPTPPDSVWATAGRQYNQHSGLYKAFMGPHHRAVWAAPVQVPVLRLASAVPAAGPLTATKLGGGFQSTSLTLKANDGRLFVIRSLDKDPARILPKFYQKTFLANGLRDGTSAGNPYGALVVSPLAQQLGVPHTHPRILYVPSDTDNLGSAEANERLRGKLVLLEEKYTGEEVSSPLVPEAQKFIDDEDMRQHLYADPRNRPDQPALLRARLLDLLIGDWDRHSGQWQWGEVPNPQRPGGRVFVAVPKDRDQAFFRMSDGVVPWLMTRKFLVRHLVTFKRQYHDLPALIGQGRHVDQRGLNALTRRDFVAAGRYVQAQLPDSTLARAVHQLPPAVHAIEGPTLLRDLQARRDALPGVAERYYELKAERPVVAGTELPDYFAVARTPDSTTVRVYNRTLGADSLFYQRTFYTRETNRLTLEGLGSNDTFELTGHGLKIVIHAGAGEDVLRATSHRRLRYEPESNGTLNTPAPTKKKEQFDIYNRLTDE